MPKYVLTFFDYGGIAETARILFSAAGVEFEDVRVSREKWAEIKPNYMFGHLPALEVDGKLTISDSGAIVRYIAREHGFSGKDSMQEAQVDSIDSEFRDFAYKIVPIMMEKDPKKKEELKSKFVSVTIPNACSAFEKVLKANNNGQGFYVGDSLTYCDVTSYCMSSQLILGFGGSSALDPYPLIKAHTDRVANIPKVKAWLDKRPKTEM